MEKENQIKGRRSYEDDRFLGYVESTLTQHVGLIDELRNSSEKKAIKINKLHEDVISIKRLAEHTTIRLDAHIDEYDDHVIVESKNFKSVTDQSNKILTQLVQIKSIFIALGGLFVYLIYLAEHLPIITAITNVAK